MRIIKDPTEKLNIKTVVALGCFDGVHIAHARVICEAVKIARERGVASVVWSFREPPKNAFMPEKAPLICDSVEKARQIESLGVDILTEVDFTREIAKTSARDFIEKLLVECSGAVHLVCGKNYTFGAGGEGNTNLLRELCRELVLGLSIVDDVKLDGVTVSSSVVREAVLDGRCVYAAKLLGRNFSLCFDTQNAFWIDKKYLCVPAGDYEVKVFLGDAEKKCTASVREYAGIWEIILDTEIEYSGRVRVEFCTDKPNTP